MNDLKPGQEVQVVTNVQKAYLDPVSNTIKLPSMRFSKGIIGDKFISHAIDGMYMIFYTDEIGKECVGAFRQCEFSVID